MGVIEVVKKQERQAGIALGIAKGKIGFVENLITQLNLPDETIAQAAEVSLEFVQEIRKKIEARKK